MTPAEAERIGRAWIAAGGGWRDAFAAVDADGHRWRVYLGSPPILCGHGIGTPGFIGGWESTADIIGAWPDLRDAATRGAALEVVRERWGDDTMHMAALRSGWVWMFHDERAVDLIIVNSLPIAGASEAEALLLALQLAPKVSL